MKNLIKARIYPFALYKIPVSVVLTLGQLCYLFAAVPPQPNSLLAIITSDPYVKSNNSISSGISILVFLLLILHLTNHSINKTELSTRGDFKRVNNLITRHLAILREP